VSLKSLTSSMGVVGRPWHAVVVQYTARLNQQKIERFLHELNQGKVSKKAGGGAGGRGLAASSLFTAQLIQRLPCNG